MNFKIIVNYYHQYFLFIIGKVRYIFCFTILMDKMERFNYDAIFSYQLNKPNLINSKSQLRQDLFVAKLLNYKKMGILLNLVQLTVLNLVIHIYFQCIMIGKEYYLNLTKPIMNYLKKS